MGQAHSKKNAQAQAAQQAQLSALEEELRRAQQATEALSNLADPTLFQLPDDDNGELDNVQLGEEDLAALQNGEGEGELGIDEGELEELEAELLALNAEAEPVPASQSANDTTAQDAAPAASSQQIDHQNTLASTAH